MMFGEHDVVKLIEDVIDDEGRKHVKGSEATIVSVYRSAYTEKMAYCLEFHDEANKFPLGSVLEKQIEPVNVDLANKGG